MATKRIKQLATLTPLATKYLAHEGDTGGTGKATITDVVASGCAALGISAPGQNQVVGFSEFDDAATGGGWIVLADKGEALVGSTLGGIGFDSTGVAVLTVNTGGDFAEKVAIIRPGTGLNCDEDTAPSIGYRFWTTHTVSGDVLSEDLTECKFTLGAAGSFGDDGPQSLVALRCDDGDWFMRTINVDGTTDDPITMPAGEQIHVRINIILGGWTCEVSVDAGESYSLVGTSSVSPDLITYVPFVILENDGPGDSNGPRFTGVDWCAWTTLRAASNASPFDGQHAFDIPPQIKLGDDGDITTVNYGGSSSAGSSGRFADAQHTHAGPTAPTIPTASGSVQDVAASGTAGASSSYSRGDHAHTLTPTVLANVAANISSGAFGSGAGAIQVAGSSVDVLSPGSAKLRGNTGGDPGVVECTSGGSVDITTSDGCHIVVDTGLNMHSNEIYDVTNVKGDGTNPLTLDANGKAFIVAQPTDVTIPASGNMTLGTNDTSLVVIQGSTIQLSSGNDIDVANSILYNARDPLSAQDVATKAYADSVVANGTYTPSFGSLTSLSAVSAPSAFTWSKCGNMVTVRGKARVSSASGTVAGASATMTLPSTPAGNFFGGAHTLNEWQATSAQVAGSMEVQWTSGSSALMKFDLTITMTNVDYLITITYTV